MRSLLTNFGISLFVTSFFIYIGADDLSRKANDFSKQAVSSDVALLRVGYVMSKIGCAFFGGMVIIVMIMRSVLRISPTSGPGEVRWFISSFPAMITVGATAVVLAYWIISGLQNMLRANQGRRALRFFPPREMDFRKK